MKIKNGLNITIGADPEFFLRDATTGAPLSAHTFLDEFGGKHNPRPVNKGAIQVDGTALEFNIDPANDAAEFIFNCDEVLIQLRSLVDNKFDFNFYPVQIYPKGYFDTLPPEAVELGCDPDFDAYTLQPNPKPNVENTMRTGSGHIHVGWTSNMDTSSNLNLVDCAALVKQLDAVLYPASTIWDKDKLRREMYGKPGAFRVKHYGLEYRVLSNYWLKYKPIQQWIFDATIRSFELLTEGIVFDDSWRTIGDDPYSMSRYMGKLYARGIPSLPANAFLM